MNTAIGGNRNHFLCGNELSSNYAITDLIVFNSAFEYEKDVHWVTHELL